MRSGLNVLERLTFDSEPILAFYLGETGGEIVNEFLKKIQKGEAEGYINIISLTEIYYILSRGSPLVAEETQKELRSFGLKVVPIEDNGLWREAGKIKCQTFIVACRCLRGGYSSKHKYQTCSGQ